MTVIYKPSGEAREYAEYAFNPFMGCRYDCSYCYNKPMFKRFHPDMDFSKPIIKPKVLEQLEKEIHKYKGKEIFMSFGTDPFQGKSEFDNIVGKSIWSLIISGCYVTLLTKSGIPEFLIHNPCGTVSPWDRVRYGATLTCNCEYDSKKFEPNAALPQDRIKGLRIAKEKNYTTWVSCEPVLEPIMTLDMIKRAYEFTDIFAIGKWNYSPEANKIDWHKFTNEAIELLEKYNKKYYIKNNLKPYIGGVK